MEMHDELPWTGERLVPTLRGDIILEHLHRYAFASEMAGGRDVLDIACGEGYGSNLLATRARTVVGVDISEEATRHATNKYARANLNFVTGNCIAIPLPAASVDMVVSFETIEHFAEHEVFLTEVRRVLRAGGIFVVSTPDKTIYTGKLGNRNQFHPRELEAVEFTGNLTANFAHTRILGQRVCLGSVLTPLDYPESVETGNHRGNFRTIHFTPRLAEAVYLIGVGSDSPLPALKVGLFEFGEWEKGSFVPSLMAERATAEAARALLATHSRQVGVLNQQKVETEFRLTERDLQIASLNNLLTERDQQLVRVNQVSAEQAKKVDLLESQIADLHQTVSEQSIEVASLNRQRTELERGLAEWGAEITGLRQSLAAQRKKVDLLDSQNADLRQTVSGQSREVDSLNRRRAELERSLAERDAETTSLKQSLASQMQKVALLGQAVDSAIRWDKRSWAQRAFHRWRPPWIRREEMGFFEKLKHSARKRSARWFARVATKPSRIRPPSEAITAPEQKIQSGHVGSSVPISIPPVQGAGKSAATRRAVFISGELDTPGHSYRVEMVGAALKSNGFNVQILCSAELRSQMDAVASADVVVFWRVAWSETVAEAVAAARRKGAKIVFDVDDLMFDPALARVSVIDGIRSQNFQESEIAELYHRIQQTMFAADFCTCTTKPLASAMRRFQKTAFVLPNGFDEHRYQVSRKAVANWHRTGDGLLRMGYAGGSRTHQRDFACAASAVARILREHRNCRLVLFRRETSSRNFHCLDIHEFPELQKLEGQVEWRAMVPVHELPAEMARFDINLAPLETGNVYCEAKSELKYFEAALVDVPTVASPTAPYAEAIATGGTGFLAANPDEWYAALEALVQDKALRQRIGKAAFLDVLWRFGPERRAELAGAIYEQILDGTSAAASREFELELRRKAMPRPKPPECAEFEVVFEAGEPAQCRAAVVVPLHNYAAHITEALESVKAQTFADKELIVVEDGSTDESLAVARGWMEKNASAFRRIALLKNHRNMGLVRTRNAGFLFTDAPFVLPFDADNVLLPKCLELSVRTIVQTDAAAAYGTIQEFGDGYGQRSHGPWNPGRFVGGNYIDAMALIRRSAWAAVGGYRRMEVTGWEDYELWCRFVEAGLRGAWVPETLSKYRVHRHSMSKTCIDAGINRWRISAEMRQLHPWVEVGALAEEISAAPPVLPSDTLARADGTTEALTEVVEGKSMLAPGIPEMPASGCCEPRVHNRQRLEEILPLIRCPATGQPVRILSDEMLVTSDGSRQWPLKDWHPIFFGKAAETKHFPDSHLSNPVPMRAMKLIEDLAGPVLNMSAGGTHTWLPHCIELETAIFRNTDIVGDGHCLPFADCVFDAVLAINAFEHYREPDRVVSEILRVLKPGGKVFIHTAFLQPLHEPPCHFFNCTKFGLLQWFKRFELVDFCVSENFNPIYALAWQADELLKALREERGDEIANQYGALPLHDIASFWSHPTGRQDVRWSELRHLSQTSLEKIAAGFEFVGQKPESHSRATVTNSESANLRTQSHECLGS